MFYQGKEEGSISLNISNIEFHFIYIYIYIYIDGFFPEK